MPQYCPKCGTKLLVGGKFCPRCGANVEHITSQPIFSTQANNPPAQQQNPPPQNPQPQSPPPAPTPQQINYNPPQQTTQTNQSSIWYQDFYKIRKKTLTVGNKYWFEDRNGNVIGFSKQKLFKLKEDIRIYTDESASEELFQIKQTQIVDAWGQFNVIDLQSNQPLGYIKRNIISAFVKDTWEIYTMDNRMVGKIEEKSTGHALARKYMPGGALIPEDMHVMLEGQVIADIKQDFKIIGDIWSLNCQNVPPNFDRRVLLACMLLMGMIERRHK